MRQTKTYYVEASSGHDRVGQRTYFYRICDATSKAEVKRKIGERKYYSRIDTQEQFDSRSDSYKNWFMSKAIDYRH